MDDKTKTIGGENQMEQKLGHYSFIGGVILAAVLGLVPTNVLGASSPWLVSLLVVLGLVVGFLNVSGKETKDFLFVSAVLIIASFAGGASNTLGSVSLIGTYLQGIFTQVLTFVVPATIVVALKDIWNKGQNQ
jgi:ATP synthase protein I